MTDLSKYTRVTEVLGVFSGLRNIPEEILRNAANRGSRVHEVCDAIMADIGVGQIDDDIAGYIESFNKWQVGKKFISKPDRWFGEFFDITGECDGLYLEGNDIVLFDIKTPLKESSTWKLQLSAYAYLARKAGIPVQYIEAVKLNKEGKDPDVYRYVENFNLFVSCLDTYRYFYKEKEQDYYLDYI